MAGSSHHVTSPSLPQAITYYEAALQEESQRFLRHDLVELYIKLRQYDKAEKSLVAALGHLPQEAGEWEGCRVFLNQVNC